MHLRLIYLSLLNNAAAKEQGSVTDHREPLPEKGRASYIGAVRDLVSPQRPTMGPMHRIASLAFLALVTITSLTTGRPSRS